MADDKNLHILVVDDVEAVRFGLRSHLRQLGYFNVATARRAEALEKLREMKDCALVLSDVTMDGTDELMLLRQIREDPALDHIKVVIVTANTNPDTVAAAKRAGASGYIVRPYPLATLKMRVQALVAALPGPVVSPYVKHNTT